MQVVLAHNPPEKHDPSSWRPTFYGTASTRYPTPRFELALGARRRRFTAQPLDVDVDQISPGIELVSPYVLAELRSREHPTG
jgi:hypothetical protein